MRIIHTLILCGFVLTLAGQSKKAKRLLDRISEHYTTAKSMEVTFDLIINYPEEEPKTYPSVVIQKGKKFVFRNSEQEYFGNGDDIWIYIPAQNEVQINDFDEDEAEDYFITPLDLLNQYQGGEYEYDIVAERNSDLDIEFKPIDEFSDYSKFRLTILKKDESIQLITAFGKDGSQVVLKINKVVQGRKYDDKIFEFDPAKYPGVRVEDLRLD